jgi:hypothetical protein
LSDTPETFNLDAWLSGASRPTRSVRIYQSGEMLAELDELAREIQDAEADDTGERSLSAPSPDKLRAKYADLLAKFNEASIDVRVHGHDEDETREIMGERFEKTKQSEVIKDLIFDALVFPKMSREQYDLFASKIGPAQFAEIASAYTAACRAQPKPSADFLPRASTPDDSE